jgi:microcystin-dependent protein
MARREYTSGRPTTLASPFAIGAGTFTIADDGSEVTWPTGADHPFWVTIDAGTAQEERVLCSGRSTRVVTVASGGRGQDGTSESNHTAGATVWPSWSATDADESNEHINLTTGVHGYSATAAEINILDGATLSTAELNILDGVTATAAEINVLDGITSSTTELNYVDGVTSAIQTQLNNNTPVGVVNMWITGTAPTGWLLCQGQAVSRTTYSALWDVFRVGGSTSPFGNGDGSTTFNLPDLRGRVPMGAGQGRNVADSANLPSTRALGTKVSDAETHTLTHAEIPNVAAPSHVHRHMSPVSLQSGTIMNIAPYDAALDIQGSYDVIGTTTAAGNYVVGPTSVQVENWQVTSSAAENIGSGGAHNNTQPSTVINFIIKT